MIGKSYNEVKKPHGADAKSIDKASEICMSNVAITAVASPQGEHRVIILMIIGWAVPP